MPDQRNKELRAGRTCGKRRLSSPRTSHRPASGTRASGSQLCKARAARATPSCGAALRGRGSSTLCGARARGARKEGKSGRRVCATASVQARRWRCPCPLVQLRHRFQRPCNPIPSDSQALSDSSDLVHPREGGKRERKKVPTVCLSWNPIDFLEEGPIPARRPARWRGPTPTHIPTPTPRSCPAQPALLTRWKSCPSVPRVPPRTPSFPSLLFLLLQPALHLPQVLTDVTGRSPHPRSLFLRPRLRPVSFLSATPFHAVGTRRAARPLPPQGAKLGKLGSAA